MQGKEVLQISLFFFFLPFSRLTRLLKCWIPICPWLCGTGMALYSLEILYIRPHCVRAGSWNESMQELCCRYDTLLEVQQIDSSYRFRWNSHCMKNWNRFESRALGTSLFLVGTLTSELFTPHKPEAKLLLPQNNVPESLGLPWRISVSDSARRMSNTFILHGV